MTAPAVTAPAVTAPAVTAPVAPQPAPLWPTAPTGPGPVDEPVAGSWSAPRTDPSAAPHRGGYLDETYPAEGFGVQAEEPPPPWQRGPATFPSGPYPGAPGGYPGAPGPYPGAPGGYPGAYPGAPGPTSVHVQPGHPGASSPAAPATTYPQTPYPPAAYPAAPYGGPVPYGVPATGWSAPPPPQDGLSIASLLVGVLGLLSCIGVFVGPVALGLGIAGLQRIKARGTRGRGLAITGIVTGSIGTVAALLVVLSIASDPQGFLR